MAADATAQEQSATADKSHINVETNMENNKVPEQSLSPELHDQIQNLSVNNSESVQSHVGKSRLKPIIPPSPVDTANAVYEDPTPKTPLASRSPSRMPSEYDEKDLPERPAEAKETTASDDTTAQRGEAGAEDGSRSEIQSIMEQFTGDNPQTQEEVMSPRMELARPSFSSQGGFPPRKSSLEPLRTSRSIESTQGFPWSPPAQAQDASKEQDTQPPPVPPKPSIASLKSPALESTSSLSVQVSIPEPEPDLPFDFHRFLEQLRHKSADPVAKFLRSFLHAFGEKPWMVHEQVKIISDFLAFITNKMAQCEVWRDVSDAEFDNAKEGMEKLVMNRLYSKTFSPAIPPPPPAPARNKGKRKDQDKFTGPGRRGQHQEDVERDEILAQKIRIYGWIREEHLEIKPVGSNGRRFLNLAKEELLKIKGYRAPRDKVICVLNCCKVIFGLLRSEKLGDTSADSFVPLLIYVVLQANPEHLVSNIQYILRFRNQDKLGGEAGYYLSSLSGAIQFIETLDRTSLSISDDEFESNVEAAVSAIAEGHAQEQASSSQAVYNEKSTTPGSGTTPRASTDVDRTSPRRKTAQLATSSSDQEDNAPVTGLLRTIQKPLSTIGRIFSDDNSPPQRFAQPAPQNTGRLSPAVFQTPAANEARSSTDAGDNQKAHLLDADEAAERQASAEAAQAQKISRAEHRNVVETLSGMFPNLDKDVIDDVVRLKEGRVGLAVDACLALSAE